ncbi:hypothetical protein BJV74DRAFT_892157 [Russula compacta]|nr:hypothetical protein BJV74DRAFT_892157 [Russula compacta]
MPVPSTKLATRASNANKHPGVPDQTKKKRSPVQMAALRASEKAAQDAKAATALAAPLIIAGVKDSMAEVDKDNEANATQPAPTKITRVNCPIRRTRTFANLDQDFDVEEVQEESGGEGDMEEFGGSDSDEIVDADTTSVVDEPSANAEYFDEPKTYRKEVDLQVDVDVGFPLAELQLSSHPQ